MISPRVRIQLTDTNQGYLDIAGDADVPLTFSVAEIRDITRRRGTFSKTIRLAGSKNNHRLLSQLFDVNIVDGTFDINKLQRCIVLDHNIPILQNAYIQLLSVNKTQTTGNHDQNVEYEAVVKDATADFFTKLGNFELTDLKFKSYDHFLTLDEVSSSWTHTWQDVYKYVMPMIGENDNEYAISEWIPGIYARQYWDKIFEAAGFRYQWDSIDNDDIQFSKLIIPYNGDKPTVTAEESRASRVEADTTLVNERTALAPGIKGIVPSIKPSIIIPDNEILDPLNVYNPITGVYTVQNNFDTQSNTSLQVEITCDYELEFVNSSAFEVQTRSFKFLDVGNRFIKLNPYTSVRKKTLVGFTDVLSSPTILEEPSKTQYEARLAERINPNLPPDLSNITKILPGQTLPVSSGTMKQKITVTDLIPGDQIVPVILCDVDMGLLHWGSPPAWTTSTGVFLRMRVTAFNVKFIPNFNTHQFNATVTLENLVPTKIKQVDFIKSFVTLYNLYITPDKEDPTKLIIQTRDEYYDSGEAVDWTKKLNKEKDQTLQFLPELVNKKILLTYKQDNDVLNKGYFDNVNEIYGQQEFTFKNEYIKGEDRKELAFSPTPVLHTSFDAFTPGIVGAEPKNNIRLLYDGGLKPCDEWKIVAYDAIDPTQTDVFATYTSYPYFGHFDDPMEPTFDINFGVCDYYFYSTNLWFGSTSKTNNNMYNLHWRRTMNQIDNNKMLTAYFDLNVRDIANLELNHKVRIDNSWWNINQIIDFNPAKPGPTKVELISIDDELKLAPFKTRDNALPSAGVVLRPIQKMQTERLNTLNLNGNNNVIGKSNIISSGSSGVFVGKGNRVLAPLSVVVGDGYTAEKNGLYAGGYFYPSDGDYPERQLPYIIDGGKDTVMNLSKQNDMDYLDGGKDNVRSMNGDSKQRPIISGN